MVENVDKGDLSSPTVLDICLPRVVVVSLILESCAQMFVGLSNLMPMSRDDHMQYAHESTHGPCWPSLPVTFSSVLTARGAVHMGQLKQFLAHLTGASSSSAGNYWRNRTLWHPPITLTSNHAARRLEQTIRTIPAHNLLCDASRTLYLMAVLTVQQLFWRIQREVGTRSSGVECLLLLLLLLSIRSC